MVTYGFLAAIPIVIHDFFTCRDIFLRNQNQMRSVHDGHCFGDEVSTPTMVHQTSQATRFSCGIHAAQEEENASYYKLLILCPPSVSHLMQIMNGTGSHRETQIRGWTQTTFCTKKVLTVITNLVRTCYSYIASSIQTQQGYQNAWYNYENSKAIHYINSHYLYNSGNTVSEDSSLLGCAALSLGE